MIEWLTEPQSVASTVAMWALTAVVAACVFGLVRLAVRAHRRDQVSASRGSKLVAAVPFAGGKTKAEPKPARANYVARIPGRAAAPQAELAKVLPLLPRAEREALRAGGWF